jgi:hypothetical protein
MWMYVESATHLYILKNDVSVCKIVLETPVFENS